MAAPSTPPPVQDTPVEPQKKTKHPRQLRRVAGPELKKGKTRGIVARLGRLPGLKHGDGGADRTPAQAED